MRDLPAWLVKVQTTWFAIGVLIMTLGAQGLELPSWLLSFVSDEVINAAMIVIGAVVSFIQLIRSKFVKDEAEVKVMSVGDKMKYIFNPFKLRA